MKTIFIGCFCLLLSQLGGFAQATIRGNVLDAFNHRPLADAHILIKNSAISTATNTDDAGHFRFDTLSPGYYTLQISFLGYETSIQSDILVGTGKEVLLIIALREQTQTLQEVEVTANANPVAPINELALVSARSFSVEETKRYAGAINDPARMALAYAGVNGGHGDYNDIIIRGNAPRGLLWRLEGIEIPNPNHFAVEGNTSGLLSILSNTTLNSSDFYTGAFPANIGNAYSGVFDLRLRNGNEEKREFSLEAGLLGISAAAEGPIYKGSRASYLASYRFSSLGLLQQLGIIGEAPQFQDLTFKINIPSKKFGHFSIFGIAGKGSWSEKEQFLYSSPDSTGQATLTEIEDLQRYEMGVAGMKYRIALSKKTYLQSYIALSGTRNLPYHSNFDRSTLKAYLAQDGSYQNTALRIGSNLYHKFDQGFQIQSGMIYSLLGFQLRAREGNADGVVQEVLNEKGSGSLTQFFIASQLQLHPKLALSTGLHTSYFSINQAFRLEPRVGLRWTMTPKQALSIGFGEHSKHEGLATYFAQQVQADGTILQPNAHLQFMKARHFVLGYDLCLKQDLFLKLEAYYQYLYDVPVDATAGSSYSSINEEVSFTTRTLSNRGSGKNVGVEGTLEKIFTRQYYFMLSAALFDATYRMPDGTVRNSKYNLNRAFNLLGGKEFSFRQNQFFGANLRTTYTGGKRIIPIDFETSKKQNREIRHEEKAYDQQLDDFFRLDCSIYFRAEGRNITHQLKLDIINLLEHNIYEQQFVPAQRLLGTTIPGTIQDVHYGDGGNTILPVLSYRVDF